MLSSFVKMSATQSIEIKCISSDGNNCEIDPEICPLLTDENLSEENVKIVNFGEFKSVGSFDIFTETRLTKVPTFILKKFKKLHSIRIYDAAITALTPESFANGRKIELLDLRRNRITRIPSNVLGLMPNLEELDLFDNKISEIEENAFDGLTNLKRLYLSGNQLTEINSWTFAGAENLQQLLIDDNQIRSIESQSFNLPNLRKIDLKNNRLESLPENLFTLSPMLEQVDVSKNRLTRVRSLLGGCKNVYRLSLSDNPQLEDADLYDTIQHLPEISYLHLANTALKLPDSTPTNEMDSPLTHVDLANNGLTRSDILNLLRPFQNLKTLELQRNHLKRLDRIDDIRAAFPRLELINLTNNALDADWFNEAKAIFNAAGVEIVT